MSWEVTPLSKQFGNWFHTDYTPIPLNKVWSTPTGEDNLNAILDHREWLQNHKDQELGFEVIEMEDGTYFAPEQYVILQSMKNAGRMVVLCHIQEYHHTSEIQK